MTCNVVLDLAKRDVREVAMWFVESADGRGPLADLRKALAYGIKLDWVLPLDELPRYIAGLRGESIYVVDDLGLPEAAALFRALTKGGYAALAECFFNEMGKTETFKQKVDVPTLVKLSKISYGQYLGMPDREVHTLRGLRLTKEEAVNVIVERSVYIVNMFARGADGLAIVSDHGYDVLKDGDWYYFAHGPYAFSKLALLLTAYRI